jgi:hypothetical protein
VHVQTPAWQVVPDGHFTPHLPQLSPSLVGSTHCVPQRTKLTGQVHTPSTQGPAVGHTTPHPPQLLLSLAVLTQTGVVCPAGMHIDSWPGHVQTPSWQESVAGHVRPQVPQLPGSLCKRTHRVPQTVHPPSKNMPLSGGLASVGGGGACVSVRLTTSRTEASRGACIGASGTSGTVESSCVVGAASATGAEASEPSWRS